MILLCLACLLIGFLMGFGWSSVSSRNAIREELLSELQVREDDISSNRKRLLSWRRSGRKQRAVLPPDPRSSEYEDE